MAFLSVFDVPTRAPSIPKAPPACQAAKSTAGQAVPPPATAGAVSGVPVAGIQQTTIHTFMVNRGTETHVFIHTYGGRKSPGYCWRTPFKVLGVLFLGKVSPTFLPSKKACGTDKLRHFWVRQQYPPVIATRWNLLPEGEPGCRTTHGKNLCPLGSFVRGFSTGHTLLACSRNDHTPYQILVAGAGGGGHGGPHASSPPPTRCPAHPLTEGSVWVSSPVPSPVSSTYSQYW